MKFPYLTIPVRVALILVVATFVADLALAGEFQRTFTFDSKDMQIESLIGQVEVVSSSGDDFRITIDVRGKDADEDLIEFMVDEGSKGKLLVAFPIEDHQKYVYPALGKGSQTQIHYAHDKDAGGSWLKKVFKGLNGRKITVKGKGNGLEIWADMTIEVPRGRTLEMKQGVGRIEAVDVEADVSLDTSSGAITGQKIKGDFLADTGSGHVTVTGVQGSVHIDTGSGRVKVTEADGRQILVDTGSGGVEVKRVSCEHLEIDTGSGQVTAMAVESDQTVIDTGSGQVRLQLDRMGSGKVSIDTGSGSITLELPENPSAHVFADTGSGRIKAELDGIDVHVKDDDEMEFTVGDGETRVVLDAGSGSITVK